MSRFPVLLIALLFTNPLFAALGPENVLPTPAQALYDGLSRGGNVLVVAQTASTAISVVAIDAAGQVANTYSFAAYQAAIATNGNDVALVTSGCGRIVNGKPAFCSVDVTWLDSRGEPITEPGRLLNTDTAFVNIDVERTANGGFVVAGASIEQERVWTAFLAPRASVLTDMRIVAVEPAEAVKIAVTGNDALVAWSRMFPGLSDRIVHARVVRLTDGTNGLMFGLRGDRVVSVTVSPTGDFVVATTPFTFDLSTSYVTSISRSGTTEIVSSSASALSLATIGTRALLASAENGVNGDLNVYLATDRLTGSIINVATNAAVIETQPLLVPRGDDLVIAYARGTQLATRTLTLDSFPTIPSALPPPAVTTVRIDTLTHVTVQWQKMPNAKLYRVIAIPADSLGATIEAPPVGPNGDTVEIDGLHGETTYLIYLLFEDENGRSPRSTPLTFTATGTLPRPPAALRGVRNPNGSYTIFWNDLSGRETSYQVRITSTDGKQFNATLPANATSHTLVLPEGSLYTVQVRAVAENGFDSASFILDTSLPPLRRQAVRR